QKLESQISTLYGGRLAEEVIYGSEKVSTGKSNVSNNIHNIISINLPYIYFTYFNRKVVR
ncbi:MAG: hypothetical protein ACTS85_03720, partial [Arsenophonus sp. NC-PG7-MAG3]